MYFSKIKNISIALCLMLLPMVANAAGLGQLTIASGIGEPLRATIELLSATPAELSTLKASLAPEAAYLAQGLEKTADHENIKITVSNKELKLSSNKAISEPFIDMLVVLEWSNGRIVRQYTALLDPPGYKQNVSKAPAPKANTFDNASVNKSTSDIKKSPQGKAVAPVKRNPTKEHLTRRGDTLSKIARRMQPDGVSLDRVLVALFEANPEAFDGKNMNRLKVGKILQAPSEEAFSAVTRKKATKEIKLQTADWNKYRNKVAEAVAKRAAKASDEDSQASSGKIKPAAEDKATPKSKTPKDVVKLSTGDAGAKDTSMQAKITALQEEISAREKGLKDAEQRTAALEKQIADMQKLLALKSDVMVDAQEKAAQTAKEGVAEAVDAEKVESDTLAEKDAEVKAASDDLIESGAVDAEITKAKTTETEAEKPKPAESTKPATEEKPSFLSSLLATVSNVFQHVNKMILWAVAGLIALLLAAWLYARNKRSKKLEDFEQGIMTSGSLKASTVFGDTATGNINTGDTSFLTDFSQSTTNGLVDTNDVDPIAEAEVYMAYGRDEQAEEILKDAISKEPQRYELHLKLLDMYAANKNTSAFETVAGEMYTTLGADDPTWQQVAEIGRELEPNNPLYQSTESGVQTAQPETPEVEAESPVEAAAPTVETETTIVAEDMAPEMTVDEEAASEEVASEEVASEGLDASDFSDSPLAAEADLDFSVSDSAGMESDVAGVDTSSSDALTEDAFNIDNSSLDIPNVDAVLDTNNSAVQLDVNDSVSMVDDIEPVSVTKDAIDESDSSLDFPTLEPQASNESAESDAVVSEATPMDIPKDLSLDIGQDSAVNAEEIVSSNDNAAVDDFDFGTEDGSQAKANEQANVMDMSDISLDISDDSDNMPAAAEEVKAETEEPLTPAFEEVETKLELVAAYIDMEDKDGATELLEEVLKEGNLSQRKRADQMLSSLV